ncbi:transcriptional regulator [Salmonella enterica]|uniref:transcriptional regulator n=1 Tax=Salmonella enterica TaxID=28901 RepID=UPI001E4E1BF6|nr:transcriptional regulator [Salmonella enterica]
MNFGERLQRVLNETGITQSELGRRVGATSQSVNGWCQSGILPRKDILELLPKATGKPLYWFFMEDDEESDVPERLTQGGLTDLNDRQKRLLEIFDQLPTVEQDRLLNWLAPDFKNWTISCGISKTQKNRTSFSLNQF